MKRYSKEELVEYIKNRHREIYTMGEPHTIMTWEEHEKEFCKVVEEKPTQEIYETCESWSEANKAKDFYEHGYEEGNVASLKIVKFEEKYYILYDS